MSAEATSVYGRAFWAGVILGWAAMVFGVVSLIAHRGATHPPAVLVWIVGLALVHDLVIAPAVSLSGRTLSRAGRRWWLGPVEGALAVSAAITLFAVPFVAGWGRQPDNPSLLPRNYAAGLALVLAGVWAVGAAALVRRARRRERA